MRSLPQRSLFVSLSVGLLCCLCDANSRDGEPSTVGVVLPLNAMRDRSPDEKYLSVLGASGAAPEGATVSAPGRAAGDDGYLLHLDSTPHRALGANDNYGAVLGAAAMEIVGAKRPPGFPKLRDQQSSEARSMSSGSESEAEIGSDAPFNDPGGGRSRSSGSESEAETGSDAPSNRLGSGDVPVTLPLPALLNRGEQYRVDSGGFGVSNDAADGESGASGAADFARLWHKSHLFGSTSAGASGGADYSVSGSEAEAGSEAETGSVRPSSPSPSSDPDARTVPCVTAAERAACKAETRCQLYKVDLEQDGVYCVRQQAAWTRDTTGGGGAEGASGAAPKEGAESGSGKAAAAEDAGSESGSESEAEADADAGSEAETGSDAPSSIPGGDNVDGFDPFGDAMSKEGLRDAESAENEAKSLFGLRDSVGSLELPEASKSYLKLGASLFAEALQLHVRRQRVLPSQSRDGADRVVAQLVAASDKRDTILNPLSPACTTTMAAVADIRRAGTPLVGRAAKIWTPALDRFLKLSGPPDLTAVTVGWMFALPRRVVQPGNASAAAATNASSAGEDDMLLFEYGVAAELSGELRQSCYVRGVGSLYNGEARGDMLLPLVGHKSVASESLASLEMKNTPEGHWRPDAAPVAAMYGSYEQIAGTASVVGGSVDVCGMYGLPCTMSLGSGIVLTTTSPVNVLSAMNCAMNHPRSPTTAKELIKALDHNNGGCAHGCDQTPMVFLSGSTGFVVPAKSVEKVRTRGAKIGSHMIVTSLWVSGRWSDYGRGDDRIMFAKLSFSNMLLLSLLLLLLLGIGGHCSGH